MAPDAYLFSYDISTESFEIAKKSFSRFKNFYFIKILRRFLRSDIDGRSVDLVF